jgi:copper chaperone CopZ
MRQGLSPGFAGIWLVAILSLTSVGAPAASAEEEQVSLVIEEAGSVQAEPRAEAALQAVPGVTFAKVSYTRRAAVVRYDPGKVKMDQLIAALGSVGFKASPAQAKYICPRCQGTYQAAGACLICETTLQPVEE